MTIVGCKQCQGSRDGIYHSIYHNNLYPGIYQDSDTKGCKPGYIQGIYHDTKGGIYHGTYHGIMMEGGIL